MTRPLPQPPRPFRSGLWFAAGVVVGVETWGWLTTPAHLRPTRRRRSKGHRL